MGKTSKHAWGKKSNPGEWKQKYHVSHKEKRVKVRRERRRMEADLYKEVR